MNWPGCNEIKVRDAISETTLLPHRYYDQLLLSCVHCRQMDALLVELGQHFSGSNPEAWGIPLIVLRSGSFESQFWSTMKYHECDHESLNIICTKIITTLVQFSINSSLSDATEIESLDEFKFRIRTRTKQLECCPLSIECRSDTHVNLILNLHAIEALVTNATSLHSTSDMRFTESSFQIHTLELKCRTRFSTVNDNGRFGLRSRTISYIRALSHGPWQWMSIDALMRTDWILEGIIGKFH